MSPLRLGDYSDHLERDTTAVDLDQVARAVKRSLKQIQYRPHP